MNQSATAASVDEVVVIIITTPNRNTRPLLMNLPQQMPKQRRLRTFLDEQIVHPHLDDDPAPLSVRPRQRHRRPHSRIAC